jgi:lysophospholipase L1-like esterase
MTKVSKEKFYNSFALMKKIFFLSCFCFLFISCARKQKTWVAIGDSLTYLNEHPDETCNRVKTGYLTRVCQQLPGIHYINQGHNGWTSVDIAKHIDELGIPRADIYTVLLGTNDWWQGHQSEMVTRAMHIIIDKIHSLNKDARIILLTPMQRGDFVYCSDPGNNAYGSYQEKSGQTLEQIASAILAIAHTEHLESIDLYHTESLSIKHLVKYKRLKDPKTGVYKNYSYPESVGIPFDPARDEYPYPPSAADKTYDGLHPSDEGNAVIADLLVKMLKGKK